MKIFILLFLVFCSIILNVRSQSTIGVDYGGNFMKVSMVSISKPIQTVLDRDSHRKTLTYVGVKDGYVVFGDAAKSIEKRHPDCLVKNIELLLGRKYEDRSVERFRKINPYVKLEKDESGGVHIVFDRYNMTFTPIVLFARLLDEIKIYSSAHSGYDIGEGLLAFSPDIDHSFVMAVRDAASISKLKLLGICDASRTLLTQYSITRKKFMSEKFYNAIFIDIGSTNTIVTIARLGLEPGTKKNTTIPSFNVSAITFTDVGAGNFDEILADKFIEDFTKKQKIKDDISKINKIKMKFIETAKSVKHCLTSSKECRVSIEEAFEEKNYVSNINRDEFRSSCSSALEKIEDAIVRAISVANIEASELSEAVIMGGGSLIPVVQDIISQKTHLTPSRVMNTDESNAAGAGILAAKNHKLFTVAEMRSHANVYYGIDVEYQAMVRVDAGVSRAKKARETLYPYLSRQTAKKVLTINNVTDDFTIRLKYSNPPKNIYYDLDHSDIMDIHIKGIPEALSKYSSSIPRSVVVHFKIDHMRIIQPYQIEYLFNKNVTSGILGKMGKAVMDLFGMNSNSTNATNTTIEENATVDSNSTNTTATNTTEPIEPLPENTKSDNFSVSLTFTIEYLHYKPMTSEEKEKSRKILKDLHQKDENRTKTTKARNDLENAIFENEQIISDEKFKEYFTDEEYQNFINVTKMIKEAFEEEGSKYDYDTSTLKLTELKSARGIADERRNEASHIDSDIKSLEETIKSTKGLAEYVLKDEQLSKLVNETYVIDALNKSEAAIEWLNQTRAEQEKLLPTDKRVLTSYSIKKRIKELEAAGGELFTKMQQAHELLEKIKKLTAESAKNASQTQNETITPPPQTETPEITEPEKLEETIENDETKNKIEL